MRVLISTAMVAAVLLSAGCSFHARDEATYKSDTRALLETKSGDIKSCYDMHLKRKDDVGGAVMVKFTVEAETGAITNASVVGEQTTAPSDLGECVVNALQGLTLDPPDKRQGDATFMWEFNVRKG